MGKRIFLFLMAMQLLGLSQQQAEKQQNNPPPTIRTSTHLVVVDVVAMDDHGHQVTDLSRDNFVVLEDGKPQQVKQFDPHISSATPASAAESGETPRVANEYKNVPAQVPNAVNVILLDLVNTALPDLQEARRHMLSYLQTMPKGRQVALYVLDTRLHLIQNFTGNSDTLIAAAQKALASPSPLKQSMEDKEADGELIETMRFVDPSGTAAKRLMALFKNTEAVRTDLRVGITVEALQQIARSLSGIPGRKNLIWLSSAFPLKVEGELRQGSAVSTTPRDYSQAIKQATSILAEAQIAVYPVDVAGLNPGGIDATTSGFGLTEMSVRDDDPVADPVTSSNVAESASNHNSMELVAKDTGGQAFYNSNDLKGAIGHSMDLGSSYYTLAYTPANNEWNGAFRKIEVKVPGKKLKLFYRRGYYALADKQFTIAELEKALVAAMDPEIADSTMLSVDVKLSPGTRGPNSVILECDLDRSQFQFVDAEKQKVAMIDLAIESWDKHGKVSGRFGQSLKIQADATHSKVGFRQEIALQPNTARLRIGILDRSSGRLGTVLIPSIPIGSTAAEARP
ncbi:MAG TPA: VWA domain-containing protein [Candidatus Angelobacter sp.]|nr:VWA domain-containing protein [Candidatus Angelobacter sp.]